MLQAVDQQDGKSCVEEWIADHQKRLITAFQLAREKTEKEALRRRKRNDELADDTSLAVGAKVFLRHRVEGRNKIQDVWDPEPYTVVRRLDTGNTYIVKSTDDPATKKTVYRKDILHASHLTPDLQDTEIQESDVPETQESTSMEIDRDDDDSSQQPSTDIKVDDITADYKDRYHQSSDIQDSSDNEEDEKDTANDTEDDEPPQPVSNVNTKVPLRRSSRKGAGKHPNLHHLPVPALVRENAASMTNPQDVINTVAQTNLLIMQMLSKNISNV
jgi:hypothetical protein